MGRNGHQKIIDSHVHLWPAAAANFQSHAWMTADHPLAKGYSISDYVHAINEDKHNDYTVTGFVYVETDRRTIDSSDIKIRTSEHLKELSFLRKIIETTLDNDTQCSISGIVAWAPLDGGPYQFQEYIEAAQEEAGALVWSKVKGFRYLLQDIKNEENFLELSESNDVVEIFKIMGKNQWSFDIGVDQRQGGSWQLQLMFDLIEKVNSHCNQHEMVTFVLNHFCKPDMEQLPTTEKQKLDFAQWKSFMKRFASFPNVYVKLSGFFSEISDQSPSNPMHVSNILDRVMPWVEHVLDCFKARRVMFGSDWPVCNIRGPGDELSWQHWHKVVDNILERTELNQTDKDRIWFGTAAEAYKIDISKLNLESTVN